LITYDLGFCPIICAYTKGGFMPEDTITVDTDDFILELSKSEYKKMKKICKKLKISLNYFIHEFDINVEAESE